jgi:FtsP/CotA-like multicopper oxidase with cupredoxin domain
VRRPLVSAQSFDFSDQVYLDQGINPAGIRGRLSEDGGAAVADLSPEPGRRNVRALEWRAGYDAAGCTVFFHRFGAVGVGAFTGGALGGQARRVADGYPVFTFPKRQSNVRRLLVQDRQDPVFDTTPGSLSANPLGLWRVWTVRFTEKVFRSRAGLAVLEEIRKRNETDADGTPILKHVSEIRLLERDGYVAVETPSPEDPAASPWVLWPLVGTSPRESIAADAYLAVATMDEGVAVDPMPEQEFLCRAQSGTPGISRMPRLPPFVQALPLPPVLEPRGAPEPAPDPGRLQGYAQAPPVAFFEVRERAFLHRFHPDLPPTLLWGYEGRYPGPTIRVRQGEPYLLRVWNDLPPGGGGGAGQPRTVCRPGLFPVAPDSAGAPEDHYPPGRFKDSYCPAGREGGAVTGRYRDGRLGFSSQNSARGLAGFMIARDTLDSGNESDPDPRALRLPSGAFDLPLLLSDRQFDETLDHGAGWDPFGMSDCFGEYVTVNGAVQPYLAVARRKYRFRLWNAGPSRDYELSLGGVLPFAVVAVDGHLLDAPAESQQLSLAPDQQQDVVVDFSRVKLGTVLFLEDQTGPLRGKRRSPPGVRDLPVRILKLLVERDAPDPSRLPNRLAERPSDQVPTDLPVRTLSFSDFRGVWTMNGRTLDLDRPEAVVRPGTREVWVLKNESADTACGLRLPVAGRLLPLKAGAASREGGGREIVVLRPGEESRLLIEFPKWSGKYFLTGSDLRLLDRGMIFRWDVAP